MQQKNMYYRTVFRRKNVVLETIYSFFLSICSIPKLMLEVFIRKNFGERYFSFSTAIITAFVLAIIPIGATLGMSAISKYGGFDRSFHLFSFLFHSLTWYLFLAAFIAMCIDRRNEIKKLPSVFDFARFSLSSGIIDSNFLSYRPYGKELSIRTIETILEPGFFFIIGLILWLFQQAVGPLIVFCSISYSISYLGAYYQGDQFIMDKIDEIIFNQELSRSFIDGLDSSQTRGVNYYGRRPADPEMRRELAETFIDSDDAVEVK